MNKILLSIALLTILGAGCVNKTNPTKGSPTSGRDNSAAIKNFCAENRAFAENPIKATVITSDIKPYYEVWKRAFIKSNGITEDYFNKHIFIGWIWEKDAKLPEGDYKQIFFSNFFKVGDMYLRLPEPDFISVKIAYLQDFKNKTTDQLISEENVGSGYRGNASSYHIDYNWGGIDENNINFLSSKPKVDSVVCEESVKTLRTCLESFFQIWYNTRRIYV